MILTCPNCGTQYVVKDGAIPPEGRQVRCASCKHSWHQDPEAQPESEAAPASAYDGDAPTEEESIAEATLIEPRTGPAAEERAYEEVMIGDTEAAASQTGVGEVVEETVPPISPEQQGREAAELAAEQRAQELSANVGGIGAAQPPAPPLAADWSEPPHAEPGDDEFTPFPTTGEPEARGRNPLLTVLMVVIAVALIAAVFYFAAPPALKAKLGLGGATAGQLAFMVTHRDRQQLESGNELVTVSGRVINPTSKG